VARYHSYPESGSFIELCNQPQQRFTIAEFDLYFCDKYHMTLRPVTMENWAQNKVAINPFLPASAGRDQKQPRASQIVRVLPGL
jgi:hypothetical protein